MLGTETHPWDRSLAITRRSTIIRYLREALGVRPTIFVNVTTHTRHTFDFESETTHDTLPIPGLPQEWHQQAAQTAVHVKTDVCFSSDVT